MTASVLHIHWAFPPTTGGVESYLIDLARLQARRGWRVTILTGEAKPVRSDAYDVISTDMLDLETARAAFADGRLPIPALEALLLDLVARRDVSVIHGHNLHHFSPAPAVALDEVRNLAGVRVHHTFHETWPDVLTDQPVYRNWEGNYAISTFIRDQCQAHLGYGPEILHLGVDTDRFRIIRTPFSGARPFRILHPARLLPWKGVHVSVQALSLLREQGWDVRLTLTDTQRIADWDHALPRYRQDLLRLVDRLELRSHVDFVSPTYEEMPALYNTVDVVLYPTIRDEPFGLVPPEAMACGRPVVASRSGGIAETMDDGVTGYLVEPDDARLLAGGVARLLSDIAKASDMGLSGRRRVQRLFSADAHVTALLERYGREREV